MCKHMRTLIVYAKSIKHVGIYKNEMQVYSKSNNTHNKFYVCPKHGN